MVYRPSSAVFLMLFFQHPQQLLHRWSIRRVVAGMDETECTTLIHDEVAAELGRVVAVEVVEFAALEPAFDIQPHHARMPGAQARAFETVGFVYRPFAVEQHGKCAADFVHPLLNGRKRAEGDDKDAGIELGKFLLVSAQLCGMLAAGYSAQVTEENQQGVVAVFQHFAQGNLFAAGGGQGEVGGGGIKFQVSGSRYWVSSLESRKR